MNIFRNFAKILARNNSARILMELFERGDIFEDNYEGWYSTTAERFWTEKDLVDGKCPDTGMAVEWIQEKNYFFKMSKYADNLRQWIEDNPTFIQPDSRRNEMLGYLRKDVVVLLFLFLD